MPYEDIEVRITPGGHVFVDTRGMAPERVKSVVEYLTEVLGPAHQIITDPREFPPQTINTDEEERRTLEEHLGLRESGERPRLRLET